MTQQEHIYVVCIKALTGLGRFCRLWNKYEYTHIAVCLDEKLEDFVTFSRKFHHSPFTAGFMHEKREHYAFGKNPYAKVKVIKVPLTAENKRKIVSYVNRIEHDGEYVFNLYAMLTMPVLHGLRIYKAHNCMSFVGKIIELSGAVTMEKPFYKYNIPEMDKLLEKFPVEEILLDKKTEDEVYMQRISPVQNIKAAFCLNAALLYRMLCKRKEKYE